MKIAYIKSCSECVSCDVDYYKCLPESKDLTRENVFVQVPEWCPLEDYEG